MAGTLTRTEIEDEALDNVAKSGVLTLQSGTTLRTRMTTWVNRAQLWIAWKADILALEATTATVASQSSYSFPNAYRKIYSLRLIDGLQSRKLTCVMPWEMDQKVPSPSSQTTQRSSFYTPFKDTGTFELFPIPDGIYTLTLRYSAYPDNFTSATAYSQFTNADAAIVAYATMFAFRWLQELKDAKDWEGQGDMIVAKLEEANDPNQIYPDWAPALEGYSASGGALPGEYYNNPFINSANVNTWWR